MKILLGAFNAGMSGSIGGTTASRNRGGAYLKRRSTPLNPSTPAQVASRAILASFAQGWRGLTQLQRDAWAAAVDNFQGTDTLGELRRPSGSQLYNRLNSVLASVGLASISNPPLPVAVPVATATSLTAAITGSTMDVVYTPPGAGTTVQVWATAGVSPGISYVKNQYRLIAASDGAVVSPLDIWADYVAKFGTPVIGTKIFVKLVTVNDASGITAQGSEVSDEVAA